MTTEASKKMQHTLKLCKAISSALAQKEECHILNDQTIFLHHPQDTWHILEAVRTKAGLVSALDLPWITTMKYQVSRRKRNPLNNHQYSRRTRPFLQVPFENIKFLPLAFFCLSFLLRVSPKFKQFPRQI